MNIIKPANKEKLDKIKGVKLFVCPHCDCEFEASRQEWHNCTPRVGGGIRSQCPECERNVYREHKENV